MEEFKMEDEQLNEGDRKIMVEGPQSEIYTKNNKNW